MVLGSEQRWRPEGGPAAAGAIVGVTPWQAVADLPPLRAGASNSESLSVSVQCQGPGSEVHCPLLSVLSKTTIATITLYKKVRQQIDFLISLESF